MIKSVELYELYEQKITTLQRSTQKHANADFLSRFPLSSRPKFEELIVSAIVEFIYFLHIAVFTQNL